MPTGVVDTPRDEHKWEKAKKIAAESGHAEDYAYIMGIYKKMKPAHKFKKASVNTHQALQKLREGKKLGASERAHLKARGLLPRTGGPHRGKKMRGQKYGGTGNVKTAADWRAITNRIVKTASSTSFWVKYSFNEEFEKLAGLGIFRAGKIVEEFMAGGRIRPQQLEKAMELLESRTMQGGRVSALNSAGERVVRDAGRGEAEAIRKFQQNREAILSNPRFKGLAEQEGSPLANRWATHQRQMEARGTTAVPSSRPVEGFQGGEARAKAVTEDAARRRARAAAAEEAESAKRLAAREAKLVEQSGLEGVGASNMENQLLHQVRSGTFHGVGEGAGRISAEQMQKNIATRMKGLPEEARRVFQESPAIQRALRDVSRTPGDAAAYVQRGERAAATDAAKAVVGPRRAVDSAKVRRAQQRSAERAQRRGAADTARKATADADRAAASANKTRVSESRFAPTGEERVALGRTRESKKAVDAAKDRLRKAERAGLDTSREAVALQRAETAHKTSVDNFRSVRRRAQSDRSQGHKTTQARRDAEAAQRTRAAKLKAQAVDPAVAQREARRQFDRGADPRQLAKTKATQEEARRRAAAANEPSRRQAEERAKQQAQAQQPAQQQAQQQASREAELGRQQAQQQSQQQAAGSQQTPLPTQQTPSPAPQQAYPVNTPPPPPQAGPVGGPGPVQTPPVQTPGQAPGWWAGAQQAVASWSPQRKAIVGGIGIGGASLGTGFVAGRATAPLQQPPQQMQYPQNPYKNVYGQRYA